MYYSVAWHSRSKTLYLTDIYNDKYLLILTMLLLGLSTGSTAACFFFIGSIGGGAASSLSSVPFKCGRAGLGGAECGGVSLLLFLSICLGVNLGEG